MNIPAVVLSCMGAPESDINVVRSLGEHGINSIVIGEYESAAVAKSRFCSEFILLPEYTKSPLHLQQALQALSQRLGTAPVVFPTADPDLAALNGLQATGADYFRNILAPENLINQLADKRQFEDLAVRIGLPVPRSYDATSMADVEKIARVAQFPLIIKPSQSIGWRHPDIPLKIARSKAIVLHSVKELTDVCRALSVRPLEVMIQEYVPGGDEEHYDVHAYIDRKGKPIAIFSGRKWRICPPHAGSGCYVESVFVPALEKLALDILNKVEYRGIANINFKRHSKTGEYKLLEINPRVSQWSILAAKTGVNLPWIAYCDACDLPADAFPPRRNGVFYVNGKADFRAFRQYHQNGEWTVWNYLRSLSRTGMVYQNINLSDPLPAMQLTKSWLIEKANQVLGRSSG